jgi:hypothetical protein
METPTPAPFSRDAVPGAERLRRRRAQSKQRNLRPCVESHSPQIPQAAIDVHHAAVVEIDLAFDVESQPAALQELSPYGDISAPHLREFFRSTKGEFRLVRLEGGRTRLEGTTWYELHIYPLFYWRPASEWIVARIHERVLHQIEADALAGKK